MADGAVVGAVAVAGGWLTVEAGGAGVVSATAEGGGSAAAVVVFDDSSATRPRPTTATTAAAPTYIGARLFAVRTVTLGRAVDETGCSVV